MPTSSVHRNDAVPADPAQAFATELMLHRRQLRQLARMLTRDPADADDLIQDTIEHALRARRRFKLGTNMIAWLRRIMRNLFTDSCRHGSKMQSLDAQEIDLLRASEARPVTFLDLISMDDVEAAVAALEPLHREPYMLSCVSRLSYRAIAAKLRVPMSTVGTRLHRAKIKVRSMLESQWCRAMPVSSSGPGVPGRGIAPANDVLPAAPRSPGRRRSRAGARS